MDKLITQNCIQIKLNDIYHNNQYIHHNDRYVCFFFNNTIHIYDYINNNEVDFDHNFIINNKSTKNNIKILFLNDKFILVNNFSSEIFYYHIKNNKIIIINKFELGNNEIYYLSIIKITNTKILINYTIDNYKYIYISTINLNSNEINIDNKINLKVDKHFITNKYIYFFSSLLNNIKNKNNIIDITYNNNDVVYVKIYRYNFITNKKKIKFIKYNKQNIELILQYKNKIYFNISNESFYDFDGNKIHSFNNNQKIIYISNKYILDIINDKNFELNIYDKINNTHNKINLNISNEQIKYSATFKYENYFIIQTESYKTYIIDIKNLNVIKKNINILKYFKYIKDDYQIFDMSIFNVFFYNNKFNGCVTYYPDNTNRNFFNSYYKPLIKENKTKFFKSKFEITLDNKYDASGRNLVLFAEYFASDVIFIHRIVADEIIKNNGNINDYGVIVPIYFSNGKKKDTQMIISGSLFKNEELNSAVQREIYEEVGLYVKKKIIKHDKTFYDGKRLNHIFTVKLENIDDLEDVNKFKIVPENNSKVKLEIFLWGKYDLLSKLIDKINYRPYAIDNDENKSHDNYIGGIHLINLSQFINA
jgi:hypothetical protein